MNNEKIIRIEVHKMLNNLYVKYLHQKSVLRLLTSHKYCKNCGIDKSDHTENTIALP